MGNSREKWIQIKNGMVKDGWKCVVELHPDLPREIRENLVSDYKAKYPESQYQIQWYHAHNAYKVLFVKPIPQPVAPVGLSVEDNKYIKPITARVVKQTQKGIEKYGTVLPLNGAPILERFEHVQQELTDGLQYNEWLMEAFIELSKHVAILDKHLEKSYSKVKHMPDHNPIRINHVKAIEMAQHIHKELVGIGQSKH
jgi:hypothetical protein